MSVFLKITSAVWVGGEIAKPGEIVEVERQDALDLLDREVAVLANEDDAPKVAPKLGLSVGDTKQDDESIENDDKKPSRKK